jgi:hypothetical protein
LLEYATEAGNLEAVRMLLDARPAEYINKHWFNDGTVLRSCIDADVVQLLLDRGADPHVVDNEGQTPLMMNGKAARVRILLDAAPDLLGMRNRVGQTAVMYLSQSVDGYEALGELFRYCDEHGLDAEVNSKAHNGDMALHIALVRGDVSTVQLLLNNGADVLGIDTEGTTVLMKPFISDFHRLFAFSKPAAAKKDAAVSVCLEILLDSVLLRGGEGQTDTQADA